MKDSLMIVEGPCQYHLQWYLAEEDDMGSNLGEMPHRNEAEYLRCCEPDEMVAYMAAKCSAGATQGDSGLQWETRALASAALRLVKAAWKEKAAADKVKGGGAMIRVAAASANCRASGASLEEVIEVVRRAYS